MHKSALSNAESFFNVYGSKFPGTNIRLIEIGSQDVNGSLRSVCPSSFEYIGVDFVAGQGVDVVLTDPYSLPFDDGFADIVVSSSCFEHSQMFWLLHLEIMRITKPGGLFYLNAPSNGVFHRYPVDCWRFYPDSGLALVAWAQRSGIDSVLLESFVSAQMKEVWNDFVAVFLKDGSFVENFPDRMLDSKKDIYNGYVHGAVDFISYSSESEDSMRLAIIADLAANQMKTPSDV